MSHNHIYTWYEERYHAIKIGMAVNHTAEERMADYAQTYDCRPSQLKVWPVLAALTIRPIEELCHQAMLDRGLVRIPPTKELFALGSRLDYDTAATLVDKVVREAVRGILETVRSEPLPSAADDGWGPDDWQRAREATNLQRHAIVTHLDPDATFDNQQQRFVAAEPVVAKPVVRDPVTGQWRSTETPQRRAWLRQCAEVERDRKNHSQRWLDECAAIAKQRAKS
jgi:hypothetical protein